MTPLGLAFVGAFLYVLVLWALIYALGEREQADHDRPDPPDNRRV